MYSFLKFSHNLSSGKENRYLNFKENWSMGQYLKRKKTVTFCYIHFRETENYLSGKK